MTDTSDSRPPTVAKPPFMAPRRLIPVTRAQTRGSVLSLSNSTMSLNTSLALDSTVVLPPTINFSVMSATIGVARKQTPKPEDFDSVIHKLACVIKEKPFISDCLELKSGGLACGFVPANTTQYFVIKLRDFEAPLNISVKRTKGKVESYFSFTSLRPGPLIYDYRFIGDHYDVFGKYSTFVEHQGCLGVFAHSDARIQVSITFGQSKVFNPTVAHIKPKMRDLKDIVEADLDRYRDNPQLKTQLDEEVRGIVARRKEALGNIDGRLFSAISVTDLHSRQLLHGQRLLQTRERKRELEAIKRDKGQRLLRRRELWQNALKESQRIDKIIMRKQSYEIMWFSLIYFAALTELLFARYRLCRLNRMRIRLEFIMAYRIQNAYRDRIRRTYGGQKPLLVTARDHLLIAKALGVRYWWPVKTKQLFACVRESGMSAEIPNVFGRFFELTSRIQKNWRRKKNTEVGYHEFLSELWEREVTAMVQRLKEKSRKKTRKNATFAKFLNINPDLKAEAIHDYFIQRRKGHLASLIFYRAGRETNPTLRKPIFNIIPKGNELRVMIKYAVDASHKAPRGSVFQREDTVGANSNEGGVPANLSYAALRAVERLGGAVGPGVLFALGCCYGKGVAGVDVMADIGRRVEQGRNEGVLTAAQGELILYSLIVGDIQQARARLDRFTSGDDVRDALRKSQAAFEAPIEVNGARFLKNSLTGEIATLETAATVQTGNKQADVEAQRKEEEQWRRARQMMEEDRIRAEVLAREMEAEEENDRKRARERENVKLDCQICYDTIKEEEYLPLEGCGHMFHPACIYEYLEGEINSRRFPLLCPFGNCKIEIRDIDLQERLSPEMYQKYEEFCFKSYVERNNAELSCCPTPDCNYVFIWTQEDPHFECPVCKKHYCLRCRCEWHKDMTCEENKQLKDPGELDKMFETLLKKTNFKQCPKCQFWVERAFGCDFIKCRCGFAFCYKCGNGFKDCTCGYGYCEKCGHDRVHCNCGFMRQQLFPVLANPPVRKVPAKRRRR